LLDYKAQNDKTLLSILIFCNPELGPKRVMQIFGLKRALETVTCRELRKMFAHYNKKSWYRLIADAKEINLPSTQSPFGIIRKHITKFKPLRFSFNYAKLEC